MAATLETNQRRSDFQASVGTAAGTRHLIIATLTESFTPRHAIIANTNTATVCHHGSGMSPGRPTNVRTVPATTSAINGQVRVFPEHRRQHHDQLEHPRRQAPELAEKREDWVPSCFGYFVVAVLLPAKLHLRSHEPGVWADVERS